MFTEIEANSVGTAWKMLLLNILEKGKDVCCEEESIKELCNVIVSLSADAALDDPIFEKLYDKKWVRFMKKNFFGLEPIKDWGYSYGQRFHDYSGNDQIINIIEKLKNNSRTKSATISLAYPPDDKKHVPCIYCIDFKIRDEMLNMTSYFRSQDAGKKFCADVICLKKIHDEISKKVGIKTGNFHLICSSMHIYQPDLRKAKYISNYNENR